MKTKMDVGFAYIGNGFSVESITSALDILPTKAWDKGEKINYEDILTKDISKDTKGNSWKFKMHILIASICIEKALNGKLV